MSALRPSRAVVALAVAWALPAASIHSQTGGGDLVRAPASPLVVTRGWSPVAAVAMALPRPSGSHRDDRLAEAYDRALLGTFQEATAGDPVQVTYSRDDTGRYFVALAAPAALPSTLDAMQRIARTGPSARLVDRALAGIRSDVEFRQDLPQSQFERVLAEHLRGHAGAADAALDPVAVEGLEAEARTLATAPPWGPPVWVVVGDESVEGAATGASSAAEPLYAAPAMATAGLEPVHTRIPSDAVTRWIGSVYRLPPETTLRESAVLKLVLEEVLERTRGPNLYELAVGIDAFGRLVVRFSTSAGAAGRWESRLDEAIAELASEPVGVRLNQSLRIARSRRSQELSSPAAAARAAAEALLRGASDRQAIAFANSAGEVPDAERISTVARGIRLVMRVVYGTD